MHRGPEVSELAHAFRARAFTRSGEIFLPDEVGPLEHGESRALVAHELTHVVQQQVLAPSMPSEDSADGQELESEAVTAERWFRQGGTPPPRLTHLPITALLARYPTRAVDPARPQPVTETGVQRLDVRDPAAPGYVGPMTTPAAGATSINLPASPAPTRAAAPPENNPPENSPPRNHAEHPATPRVDDRRPADLDDPTSLEELTRKIYPRLRRLLRGELLADRERAGLLSDFS